MSVARLMASFRLWRQPYLLSFLGRERFWRRRANGDDFLRDPWLLPNATALGPADCRQLHLHLAQLGLVVYGGLSHLQLRGGVQGEDAGPGRRRQLGSGKEIKALEYNRGPELQIVS